MRKPIIGIIGKVQPQYGEDIWRRIDEVDEIRYLIVKNGGMPYTLYLKTTEEKSAYFIMNYWLEDII